ncbi:hypothetical protein JCM10914A_24260 [Paenibacillus sp. JCM 10914]|uniref:zinc-dependent alcohol dehydrogenase n=1 Tax=Paenibacillus sp. JCM 10914 TaxID=1236974 RepID=UPI0003CC41FB|nr:zinc-binding alcohol dehydrogenase [Paenibacillus sp. JCM 10914]GAE06101.1 putatve zinc-binding dehydrogenase [Paenibacillus sp. JCM 10914]
MKAVATIHGQVIVDQVDQPEVTPSGHVRIRTEYSAVSPGTEMIFIRQASGRKVVMGYSAVGIVEQVGEHVQGIAVGQRVACYGAPYVRHAEFLNVPSNLTAVVPDHVDPQEAAFAGLGAIAIHALRVADLRFGESAVVVGLGILGQLIAQIANAAAYPVAGYDLNAVRAAGMRGYIAHAYHNQEQLEEHIQLMTRGHGVDSVILCASGPGEELINASMRWIRDRGKIVIVGDLATTYSRNAMFGKEAQVLISRAGGPGRYDTSYELENTDYPIGFVRWTEGRNMAEYIRLLAEGRIAVKSLISHVVPVDQASTAYARYGPGSSTLGTVFKYA